MTKQADRRGEMDKAARRRKDSRTSRELRHWNCLPGPEGAAVARIDRDDSAPGETIHEPPAGTLSAAPVEDVYDPHSGSCTPYPEHEECAGCDRPEKPSGECICGLGNYYRSRNLHLVGCSAGREECPGCGDPAEIGDWRHRDGSPCHHTVVCRGAWHQSDPGRPWDRAREEAQERYIISLPATVSTSSAIPVEWTSSDGRSLQECREAWVRTQDPTDFVAMLAKVTQSHADLVNADVCTYLDQQKSQSDGQQIEAGTVVHSPGTCQVCDLARVHRLRRWALALLKRPSPRAAVWTGGMTLWLGGMVAYLATGSWAAWWLAWAGWFLGWVLWSIGAFLKRKPRAQV